METLAQDTSITASILLQRNRPLWGRWESDLVGADSVEGRNPTDYGCFLAPRTNSSIHSGLEGARAPFLPRVMALAHPQRLLGSR